MYIGIVGSGSYKNKFYVLKVLRDLIHKNRDIIVSGHSPRNNYNNVDIWAEEWAKEYCIHKTIIYKPLEHNKLHYFKRNKQIALRSDMLLVFIPKNMYKSGAWNTVKHFVEDNNKNLRIYYDNAKWKKQNYPSWLKKKLKAFRLYNP